MDRVQEQPQALVRIEKIIHRYGLALEARHKRVLTRLLEHVNAKHSKPHLFCCIHRHRHACKSVEERVSAVSVGDGVSGTATTLPD
jgi:hypothetical protein